MTEEIHIPEGYEEVPAGEAAPSAQYKCGKCKIVFVAAHYASARMATGRTITHCGEPAWWIRNLRKKQVDLFNVVSYRNGKFESVAFYGKPKEEADKIAAALNDGLQDKAKTMGFYYKVVQQTKPEKPWWKDDPIAQAEMRRGA